MGTWWGTRHETEFPNQGTNDKRRGTSAARGRKPPNENKNNQGQGKATDTTPIHRLRTKATETTPNQRPRTKPTNDNKTNHNKTNHGGEKANEDQAKGPRNPQQEEHRAIKGNEKGINERGGPAYAGSREWGLQKS